MAIVFVLNFLFLRENPRYQILVKDFQKGYLECKKMLKSAKKLSKFENLESGLKKWKTTFEEQESKQSKN